MIRYRGKHEHNQSMRSWFEITVVFCSLGLFVLSAFKIATNVIENRKAENSYAQLQSVVRYEEYTATISQTEGTESNIEKESTTEITKESGPIEPRQQKSMNFSGLKEVNPDIIGWLRAEGTNIDYPIVKTENNEFYLNHLYNKELNSNGTIFVDYRNIGDFTDKNTVIYGHHMKNKTMFYALEEYKDQEFYDLNPTMTLFTPEGDYLVELICGTVEDGNYEFVQFDFADEAAFSAYIDSRRARSTFQSNVEIMPDDRIISLCTCSYEWSNARFMIVGRLVPIMENVNETSKK